MKLYESEFDYYPMFTRWLEWKGYTVFQSVRIDDIEIDILGKKKWKKQDKYTLASIEVKTNTANKALQQALIRLLYVDYSYVGFWINDWFSYIFYTIAGKFKWITEHGIGVVVFDDLRETYWVVIWPTKSKIIHESKKEQLLKIITTTQTKLV